MLEKKKKKAIVLALYLPQFHPIEENDKWWGKGFTEWTNTAKAKSLFRGHYQPRIPADLGFYDLRIPDVRIEQAKMATQAGISAFCYWHYWLGDGKQLLEKPLQDVLVSGEPDFPFCLAWANHSWRKKDWNSETSRLNNELLVEQTYPGPEDVDNHFYKMLPFFKDHRYFKIQEKLVFVFYSYENIPNSDFFVERWQQLAKENGLSPFYFIANTSSVQKIKDGIYKKLDAVSLHLLHNAFKQAKFKRIMAWLLKRPLNITKYSDAILKYEDEIMKDERVFPTIYPNWDSTPRNGVIGTILHKSSPELFKKHVKRILSIISHKNPENKVIFLKSWNEWAEGNYMEPDLRYGRKYLDALEDVIIPSSKDKNDNLQD